MENIFNKSLIDNIRIENDFILEELLHIAYVINFLSCQTNTRSDNYSSSSSRIIVSHLKSVLIELIGDIENSASSYENLQNLYKQCVSAQLKENDCINFYSQLVDIISKKDETLEKLDFMQKKIVSIIESFPGYYPSPKESSIKDATKIHLFMEYLTKEFQSSVKNREDTNVYFYWDFLPDVKFIESSNNLIINTDSFLPFRQSHWIILFHEVFHHMIEKPQNNENNDDFKFSKEYILNTIKQELEDIEIIISRNIKSVKNFSMDFNLLVDIFIDLLLVDIFGIKYLIPMTIKLFALDEENFYTPNYIIARRWYAKIKSAVDYYIDNISRIERDEQLKSIGEKFSKSINSTLFYYKNCQISTKLFSYKTYMVDSVISKIANRYMDIFFKKEKKNINLLKESFKNNKNFVRIYEKYLNSFILFHYKNTDDHPKEKYSEGRALCKIFTDYTSFKYESDINSYEHYFELPVYNFRYIKIRYDALKDIKMNAISDFEMLHAYNYGPYSFLSIKADVYEKKPLNDKEKKLYINLLKKISGSNQEYTENYQKEQDIQFILGDNNIPFYQEDMSLTLYDKEEKEEIDEILKSAKNYCYIFIKYQLNAKDKTFSSYSNLKDIFKKIICNKINKDEKYGIINIFHFISFNWFDFCSLILLKPKEGVNLSDFLSELKKNLIIDNACNLLRTETNIFIGSKIINNVFVIVDRISFRFDSYKLGEELELINKLKQDKIIPDNWSIDFCYGIMDIVVKINNDNPILFSNLINNVYKMLETGYFTDFQIIPEVQILD